MLPTLAKKKDKKPEAALGAPKELILPHAWRERTPPGMRYHSPLMDYGDRHPLDEAWEYCGGPMEWDYQDFDATEESGF